MERVKCAVEECKYNKNQLCQARGIQVRSNGDMSVETADGTACETFVSKYE